MTTTNDMLDHARRKGQVFTFAEYKVIAVRILYPDGYVLLVINPSKSAPQFLFDRWSDNKKPSDAMASLNEYGYIWDEFQKGFTKNGILAPSFSSIYEERPNGGVKVQRAPRPIVATSPIYRPYRTIPLVSPIKPVTKNPALDTVTNGFAKFLFDISRSTAQKPKSNLPPRGKGGRFMAKKLVAYFYHRKVNDTVQTYRKVVVDEGNSNGAYLRGYDTDRKEYRSFHRANIKNLSENREWVEV